MPTCCERRGENRGSRIENRGSSLRSSIFDPRSSILTTRMLVCPMCKKGLPDLARQCPRCRTDLTLLVDYVDALQVALARADARARAGELGEAVWAYLEVLEVDPDNPIARRQVSQVVTAVRQFDRATPGRRW